MPVPLRELDRWRRSALRRGFVARRRAVHCWRGGLERTGAAQQDRQGELWVAVGRPAAALAPAPSSHATRWRCTAHARAKVPWSTTSTLDTYTGGRQRTQDTRRPSGRAARQPNMLTTPSVAVTGWTERGPPLCPQMHFGVNAQHLRTDDCESSPRRTRPQPVAIGRQLETFPTTIDRAEWCRHRNSQLKVLSTGFLHQQSSAHPQGLASRFQDQTMIPPALRLRDA